MLTPRSVKFEEQPFNVKKVQAEMQDYDLYSNPLHWVAVKVSAKVGLKTQKHP